MLKNLIPVCMVAGLIALYPVRARGQWIVHAAVGTVQSVNPATGTINVLNHGLLQSFSTHTKTDVKLEFDKSVRAESTSSEAFRTAGAFVVVLYYGIDGNRTAVAIHDLGPGPFIEARGTVVRFDDHTGRLTVQTNDGKKEVFSVTDKTVVDLPGGVGDGGGFSPDRGDHVRVTAAALDEGQRALFIHDI